jgi:putative ABC transport system ATP-binding protein
VQHHAQRTIISPVTVPRDDIIQVRDVHRSLPLDNQRLPILRGVSFAIPRRAWIGIVGPSGSGKSTLLGILAGLDSPDGGKIVVDGQDITHLPESQLARFRNQKIGMVFQSFNLIPNLTALENAAMPLYAGSHPTANKVRAKMLLGLVGLGDRLNHLPHQLSGGQQQRVAIARALINQPAVLVADEPTGNLDSATGKAVLDLLEHLRRDMGLTLVIATHDPAVMARTDGALHLVDGQLVEEAR